MFKQVEAKLTPEIIENLTHRYGLTPSDLVPCGGFESVVYLDTRKDTILKITLASLKRPQLIQAELDFVERLYTQGAPVSPVIRSLEGKMIETLDIKDDAFVVRCYRRAPGKPPTNEDWNPDFYYRWGKVMGQIHALTPKQNTEHLACWENPRLDLVTEEMIPIKNKLLKELGKLPKDDLRPIHSDMHTGNLMIDGPLLTVFDFDDLEQSWFISDIATAVYTVSQYKKEVCLQTFFDQFMIGYRESHRLDDWWLKQLPTFLKLRHLLLYVVFTKVLVLENQETLIETMRQEILTEDPLFIP